MAIFSFAWFMSSISKTKPIDIKSNEKEISVEVAKVENYSNVPKATTKQEADAINRSFRESDYNQNQELDFVCGIEIKRSNNPDVNCEICRIATGKYPKDFKWTGWHYRCKCFIISILATHEEFITQQKKILAGNDNAQIKSVNRVLNIPIPFKTHVLQNLDKYLTLDWYINNKKYFK